MTPVISSGFGPFFEENIQQTNNIRIAAIETGTITTVNAKKKVNVNNEQNHFSTSHKEEEVSYMHNECVKKVPPLI